MDFSAFSGPSLSSLGNALSFSSLTPKIRTHLVSVYSTLSLMVVAACLGSYLHLAYGIGSLLFTFAAVALIFVLAATPNTPHNKQTRVATVLGFGLCQASVATRLCWSADWRTRVWRWARSWRRCCSSTPASVSGVCQQRSALTVPLQCCTPLC